MKSRLLVVLAVGLLLSLCADQVAAAPVAKGSKELSGSFSFTRTSYSWEDNDLGSVTLITLSPGCGKFFTDQLEVKMNLQMSYVSYDNGGSESLTTYGGNGLLLWHFTSESNVVPFVGGGVGVATASDSFDTEYDATFILPIVGGGVRIFLTDSVCLNVEAFYNHQVNGRFIEDISGNEFGVAAGFSVFP